MTKLALHFIFITSIPFLFFAAAFPSIVHAETLQVALGAGYSVGNRKTPTFSSKGLGGAGAYEMRISYRINSELSAGIFGGYRGRASLDSSNPKDTHALVPLGVEFNGHFDNAYAGASLGQIRNLVLNDGSSDGTRSVYQAFVGAQAGYLFPILDKVALGTRASYIYGFTNGPTGLLSVLGEVAIRF
jgi:hypothetical protein